MEKDQPSDPFSSIVNRSHRNPRTVEVKWVRVQEKVKPFLKRTGDVPAMTLFLFRDFVELMFLIMTHAIGLITSPSLLFLRECEENRLLPSRQIEVEIRHKPWKCSMLTNSSE